MTILSHSFWQRKFGSDSSVIGKTIQIWWRAGHHRRRRVAGPSLGLSSRERNRQRARRLSRVPHRLGRRVATVAGRVNVFLRVIGRLKPGATLGDARRRSSTSSPPTSSRASRSSRARTRSGARSRCRRTSFTMCVRRFSRSWAPSRSCCSSRARTSPTCCSFAPRRAIASSRFAPRSAAVAIRLIGQMLAESVVLAVGGAVLGLFFAQLGIELLLGIAPATLPRVARRRHRSDGARVHARRVARCRRSSSGFSRRCARRARISRRRCARADARPASARESICARASSSPRWRCRSCCSSGRG